MNQQQNINDNYNEDQEEEKDYKEEEEDEYDEEEEEEDDEEEEDEQENNYDKFQKVINRHHTEIAELIEESDHKEDMGFHKDD